MNKTFKCVEHLPCGFFFPTTSSDRVLFYITCISIRTNLVLIFFFFSSSDSHCGDYNRHKMAGVFVTARGEKRLDMIPKPNRSTVVYCTCNSKLVKQTDSIKMLRQESQTIYSQDYTVCSGRRRKKAREYTRNVDLGVIFLTKQTIPTMCHCSIYLYHSC